jgi:hypothetical protein
MARLIAALLAVMTAAAGCASASKPAPARAGAPAPQALAGTTTFGEAPSAPADCEAQVRAQHSSYLTQLALRHGVAGTLYLSFVGAAQGAFYGAVAGGGHGAGQGAWIGAAVGAGVGLVMGSIEGVGRAREARVAYESALASCRTAALIPPDPPASPRTEPAEPTSLTPTLDD